MAKKSLNMIEKMMDTNIIDCCIINCAMPSIITIENRYQIDFGKPALRIDRLFFRGFSPIPALRRWVTFWTRNAKFTNRPSIAM